MFLKEFTLAMPISYWTSLCLG